MSDTKKIQVNVKDNDGDMVNVYADSNEELDSLIAGFPHGAWVQFKANLRGSGALAQSVQADYSQQGLQQPQPQAAWGTVTQQGFQPAQQGQQWSQPAQQAPPQQQGGRPQATLHPEGKQCQMDGKVLELKTTTNGKRKWQCPDWRWNNGNPNGHAMEWAN
jgi:hypothetical protein